MEKIHAGLYQKMLDNLGSSQESYSYYVCPVCGFTAEKEAPGVCPVCGTKGELFKKVIEGIESQSLQFEIAAIFDEAAFRRLFIHLHQQLQNLLLVGEVGSVAMFTASREV